MKFLIGLLLFLLTASEANAVICGSVPYTFVPGTTGQSGQVNANFTALQNCINSGAAASGTNSDISILNGTGAGVSILGTPTNSSASTGYVGEYVSSDVPSGSPVTLSNNVAKDITSVSLTSGDWDCNGDVVFNNAAGQLTQWEGWLSSTSATLPTNLETAGFFLNNISGNVKGFSHPTGTVRFSSSGSITVYLSVQVSVNFSGQTVYGFLRCRRVR